MPIRPIDLQVIIPRVDEIGKRQQGAEERNQAGNEKFMLNFQQEAKNRETQVQTSHKSEQEKINSQNKNKENHQHNQKNKKKKDKEVQKELTDPTKGTLLDIRT